MTDEGKKKRINAELTDEDVLAILNWQLSLPAEQMDCDLMRECDLYLSPDAPSMDAAKKRQIHDALMAHIQGESPARAPRRTKPARSASARISHRRLALVALLALLLLALAVGGVAYSMRRGVLNFNEDWGWSNGLVYLPGAEEFVVSGSLAHLELSHVTIDVIEAVTDGADLRVVYSVTNNEGLAAEISPGTEYHDVPGAAEDGVHMCDWIEVNGEDAYFDDAFEAPGEAPGQILYYLQTNLPSWGIDVSECDELTIALPLLARKEGERAWQTISFTIPAKIDETQVKSAQIVSADMDGHSVSLLQAVFSPLNGYAEIEIEGLTREQFQSEFTSLGYIYGPDDYALAGAHLTTYSATDCGSIIGFTVRPPENGWPDTLVLALERTNYEPDWEVTIRLTDTAAENQ